MSDDVNDNFINNCLVDGRKIVAIVSVDKNWGIGNAGKLLAHLPGDMKFFKEKTFGNIVLMGRKTFESLPEAKPLPGRLNVVVTRNEEYAEALSSVEGILTAKSVENAIEMLKADEENMLDKEGTSEEDMRDLFVIGGGEIYMQCLPFVDSCLVTKFDAVFEADTFFPDIDNDARFKLTKESELVEENGIEYVFTEYSKVVG